MRRVSWLVVGVVVGLGVGGATVSGQDMTTLLTQFLNGLYSGYIRVGDGSASVPSYAFASDPDTGVYLATEEVDLTIGGTRTHRFGATTMHVASDTGAVKFGAVDGDTALTRAAAGELTWTAVLFANLGTPANGTVAYCSNCTIANPCAGGGTGALAKRLNGAWVCN